MSVVMMMMMMKMMRWMGRRRIDRRGRRNVNPAGSRRPNASADSTVSGRSWRWRGRRWRDQRVVGSSTAAGVRRLSTLYSHHLKDLTSFESRTRQKYNRATDVSALDAYHVRKFIVAKVRNISRLLLPRIPDDRIRKIVLLYSHLSSGHNVRNYVLGLSILIDPVRPLTNSHHVQALLEDLVVPRLQLNWIFITWI